MRRRRRRLNSLHHLIFDTFAKQTQQQKKKKNRLKCKVYVQVSISNDLCVYFFYVFALAIINFTMFPE